MSKQGQVELRFSPGASQNGWASWRYANKTKIAPPPANTTRTGKSAIFATGGLMRTARLQPTTLFLAAALTLWFALDFVGWPRLVEREPLISLAGLMLALMLLFIAGGIARLPYLALFYFIALAAWAYLQWQTHWSTYLFSASAAKLDWCTRAFGDHWRLLPERANHSTPDAYHTILALLILCNLASACRDLLSTAALGPENEARASN